MPTYVEGFEFGWKALNGALNDLADANNSNVPLEGHGIRIEETKNGLIISVGDKTIGYAKGQGLLEATGTYNMRLYDVSFMPATIVDPTTCEPTFVQVLIQDPGGWTDIDIDLQLDEKNHPEKDILAT